jgi:heavy metal translocating P-type ATPase
MNNKAWRFIRHNPIPPFALAGLLMGLTVQFAFNRPGLADAIWLATLAIGGAPIVLETLKAIRSGDFASDVVAMLAIITALLTHEYFAGVIIVLMQSGGEALENYSLRRASSALEALLQRAPRLAHRLRGEGFEEIPVDQVNIGDDLLVRPGDLVPVDGAVLSAQADVDESALTGEPLSRSKNQGDLLLSGSVNLGDAFQMKATKRADQSQYAQIVRLVQQAQAEKPPLQRLADQYAAYFTPVTLFMCLLGYLITRDPLTILSVLVVATPCPLILATPVAVLSGINRAARAGLIVKGGTAIEQLGKVRVMVFDKTGTLTMGLPTLHKVITYDGYNGEDVLRIAGSVEQLSAHVLAQAVTAAALQASPRLPHPIDFHEQPGYGVEATVDGQPVLIGSPRLLHQRLKGISLPEEAGQVGPTIYVAIGNKLAGLLTFQDALRPGAPALISKLRALGVGHIAMLTGDLKSHAADIAKQVGIQDVRAELLPQGKVEAIKELQGRYGSVAMVGDGINDAPALATATVGIAMGAHGTGISAEAADVVLLVDDVMRIANGIEAGQRMMQIAKQSIYFGLGLSFLLMIVAAFGLIPPAIGALFQEAIDVAVILNALRAR